MKEYMRSFMKSAAAVLIAVCAFLFISGSVKAAGNIEVAITEIRQDNTEKIVTVLLELKNNADDFNGYVRVRLTDIQGNGYNLTRCPVGYERYISAAAGSKQNLQISFPMPGGSPITKADARIIVTDEKGKELVNKPWNISYNLDSASYGVLSDSPASLEYFELSGEMTYMQRLLTAADLEDTVNFSSCAFLIIDDYDTSLLSDKAVKNVENWVKHGGVLVIGTGKAGDKTFKAFSDDITDVKLTSKSTSKIPTYYSGYNNLIDCADIQYGRSYGRVNYDGYSFDGTPVRYCGSGCVLLFPFALSDKNLDTGYLSTDLYYSVLTQYSMGKSGSGYSDPDSLVGEFDDLFDLMQGKSGVNAGILMLIVAVYIIVVGPVLYLLLKSAGKREKVWLFIPAIAFVAVILVFFASRGFDISSKYLACVVTRNASGGGVEDTYISGYSAKVKPWKIKVEKDAKAAGLYYDDGYYDTGDDTVCTYVSSLRPDGYELSCVPKENFDKQFFKVTGENNNNNGTLDARFNTAYQVIKGNVKNNTDTDFEALLVVDDGCLAFLDGVKAGGSISVNTKAIDANGSHWSVVNRIEDMVDSGDVQKAKYCAALLMASESLQGTESYVIGVAKSKDCPVTSNEKKDVYLCLYSTGGK
ncbi:MAG: hypothetical protein K5987_07585 [Lachnospiraceae bacterium]|nr:hypothetical protein [Lachnospiraceae bacterium]